MIRVKIFKNSVQTHGADFQSLIEAQAWIDGNVASNVWGKPERWLNLVALQSEGLDTTNAAESRETDDGQGSTYTEWKFLSEYNIETLDVTSEYEEKLYAQESKEAIDLGVEIVQDIRTLNKKKLRTGEWTATEFNSLMVNSTVANIERSLWNGSLGTAKALIFSLSSFYSEVEKAVIIAKIDSHLLKWS